MKTFYRFVEEPFGSSYNAWRVGVPTIRLIRLQFSFQFPYIEHKFYMLSQVKLYMQYIFFVGINKVIIICKKSYSCITFHTNNQRSFETIYIVYISLHPWTFKMERITPNIQGWTQSVHVNYGYAWLLLWLPRVD